MEARSQLRHRPTPGKTVSLFSVVAAAESNGTAAAGGTPADYFEKMGTIRQETGVYRDRVSEHSAAGGAVFLADIGLLGQDVRARMYDGLPIARLSAMRVA
jgi:hypothetical protein